MRPHPTSRRLPAALLAALALVVASTASAGQSRDALIRPGVSVGKVRLGMSVTQLRKALGKPWTVVTYQRGFGRRQLELQYASLQITAFGRDGAERVVIIESKQERERTVAGIGIGVREAVLRAQQSVACEPHRGTDATIRADFYNRIGGDRTCWIDAPNGARTLFISTGPRMRLEGPGDTPTRAEFERRWEREAKIALVIVRAAGYKSSAEQPPPS